MKIYAELIRNYKSLGIKSLRDNKNWGFSEIGACLGVRPFITTKGFTTIYTAYTEHFVDTVLSKCWVQLNWLNQNTDGGMKRLRQKIDNIKHKRASLVDSEGIEFGRMADIEGITADNPRKIRGERVDRLLFEEAGSNPILSTSWTQGTALVELGGARVGIKIGWGCVCAGTKVWINNGEQINIENISQDMGIVGFKNGQSNKEPITYIQEPLHKECVRITTDQGILECSTDHPILFMYKKSHREGNKRIIEKIPTWVEAKDVMPRKSHNTIYMCDKVGVFGEESIPDPRLIGMLIGDGSYGINKTPRFCNCDPELNNYVKSNYKTSLETSHITTDGRLYEENRILDLVPTLKSIGIYEQTKNNKRLPNNFLRLNKNDAALLLAGLFDTDGYINPKKGIQISQSCKELIEQIQLLLKKFGIWGKIYYHKPCIKEGRKDKNGWYDLNVRDQLSCVNFYKSIPLLIKYKQESLKQLVSPYIDKILENYNGTRTAIVKSIENIGVQRIYNLTANDSHTYLANDIITHNTGGDTGPALAGLAKMFEDPLSVGVLPYKNFYSDDGTAQYTGFFIPAYEFMMRPGYIDNRGVTDTKRAKAFYEEQRKLKSGEQLLEYCSEHCFTPKEALLRQGENIFDSVLIADRITQIRVHKMGTSPQHIALLWDREDNDNSRNKVKAVSSPNSKILVYEEPKRDSEGNIYNNLYVAGIDSIDQGTGDSATQYDVSDFCIVVKRRVFGLNEPKYVCIYKDRPRDIREAYENAMKILVWYNCKALLEHTKISILTYFREKKKDSLFMRRPKSSLGDIKKGNSAMIGVPATETIIKHGLELINNFVNDYCYGIDSDEMLEQLLNYSYENKRKFDIVAALGMCEMADEELTGINPKVKNEVTKTWKDIGWYIDDRGYKRYGIIPTTWHN